MSSATSTTWTASGILPEEFGMINIPPALQILYQIPFFLASALSRDRKKDLLEKGSFLEMLETLEIP